MTIQFTIETGKSNPQNKRLLIVVVLIFGAMAVAGGSYWLRQGSIEIRGGRKRVGFGGGAPVPVQQQPAGPVAGRIAGNSILFLPLCIAWIALGVSMLALASMAIFSSNEVFLKLSAYSCVAILLLAFGTVGAALWSGP